MQTTTELIKELHDLRKVLKKMLKVYTRYEGKNLNRYKNIDDILSVNKEAEQAPFTFIGLFSRPAIDYKNIDTTPIKKRLNKIEEAIHDLDLFEVSDMDEYVERGRLIKRLIAENEKIHHKYPNIPSYLLRDLLTINKS